MWVRTEEGQVGKEDRNGRKLTCYHLVIVEQYRVCPSTNESPGCLTDDLLGSSRCESKREAGGIERQAPGSTQAQEGDLIAAIFSSLISVGLVASNRQLGRKESLDYL